MDDKENRGGTQVYVIEEDEDSYQETEEKPKK